MSAASLARAPGSRRQQEAFLVGDRGHPHYHRRANRGSLLVSRGGLDRLGVVLGAVFTRGGVLVCGHVAGHCGGSDIG